MAALHDITMVSPDIFIVGSITRILYRPVRFVVGHLLVLSALYEPWWSFEKAWGMLIQKIFISATRHTLFFVPGTSI